MFQAAFYFLTKFTDWMFKQRTEIVVLLAVALTFGGAIVGLWLKIGNMEADAKTERVEIRRECSESIAELRSELRMCQNRNDTLTKENSHLLGRLTALEARVKR